jgi:putative ABC transport system substrate-binding protein
MEAAMVFWDHRSMYQWQETQDAAASLGLRLAGIELRDLPYDYDQALARIPPDHRGTLLVMASPLFFGDRQRLADFARRQRIASVFGQREHVDAGGLLSYGPSIPGMYRRAAEYVDKIARGANTTDLPIEQPTGFEFIINLKTAKLIGKELPTSILLRADEVIGRSVVAASSQVRRARASRSASTPRSSFARRSDRWPSAAPERVWRSSLRTTPFQLHSRRTCYPPDR